MLLVVVDSTNDVTFQSLGFFHDERSKVSRFNAANPVSIAGSPLFTKNRTREIIIRTSFPSGRRFRQLVYGRRFCPPSNVFAKKMEHGVMEKQVSKNCGSFVTLLHWWYGIIPVSQSTNGPSSSLLVSLFFWFVSNERTLPPGPRTTPPTTTSWNAVSRATGPISRCNHLLFLGGDKGGNRSFAATDRAQTKPNETKRTTPRRSFRPPQALWMPPKHPPA